MILTDQRVSTQAGPVAVITGDAAGLGAIERPPSAGCHKLLHAAALDFGHEETLAGKV